MYSCCVKPIGTLECVIKPCRKCKTMFLVTKAELQQARRGKEREPCLCERCR